MICDEDEEPRCDWCDDVLGESGIHFEPEDPAEEEADFCSIACWLAAQ